MNSEHKALAEKYIILEKRVKRQENCLKAYQHATNKLDDWFEYMNESVEDRKKVHEILDSLTKHLDIIVNGKR